MVQRLGSTEVQQRDADTGGEQHPRPGPVAEIRGVVLAAQLQLAVGRKRQNQHEQQVAADHQHVIPAETSRQPFLGLAQDKACSFGNRHQQRSQQQNQRGRCIEHDPIEPDPLGRGLHQGGRTHCTEAPGSARERHDRTHHPGNWGNNHMARSDIKAPQSRENPVNAGFYWTPGCQFVPAGRTAKHVNGTICRRAYSLLIERSIKTK
ncbi:hypothetical protein D9M71_453180 [compost metagenome]